MEPKKPLKLKVVVSEQEKAPELPVQETKSLPVKAEVFPLNTDKDDMELSADMIPAMIKIEKEKLRVVEEILSGIKELIQTIKEKAPKASLGALANAIGTLSDKAQMLSGGATVKAEIKSKVQHLKEDDKNSLYNNWLRNSGK